MRFWVEYHLLLGFTHIFVYDRWGDHLREALHPYVAQGTATLVPFPFFSEVQVPPADNFQLIWLCHSVVCMYNKHRHHRRVESMYGVGTIMPLTGPPLR